jgi:hypothetical protein
MEDGLLFRAVGDADVEWEEVAGAVGPHQTAVSCWSRWVIVGELADRGSSLVVPRPVTVASPASQTDSGDESPPPPPRRVDEGGDGFTWDDGFPHCPFRL